jgi:hypothetical protein
MDDPKSRNPFACIQPNPSLEVDSQNSWGRQAEIVEGQQEEVVRVQLPVMAYVTFVGRATAFDNGTNDTQLYPFARIKYGNGNVLQETVIDLTGGWSETVVGSSFYLTVFLADANGMPPENGSGAEATFQAWASVGILPYPERNSQNVTSTETGPTALIAAACDDGPVQGRLARLFGFVDFAGSPPAYLLVFDSNIAPGATGFGSPKIIDVFPVGATGITNFDRVYTNTTGFINGIAYGLSSSSTSYMAATAAVLRITAEQLLDT